MSLDFNNFDVGELAGLFGNGLVMFFGGSLVMLGISIVFITAFLLWRKNATIMEAYFIMNLELVFLRFGMNTTGFNDVGLFGLLHNLILLASSIVAAAVLAKRSG